LFLFLTKITVFLTKLFLKIRADSIIQFD